MAGFFSELKAASKDENGDFSIEGAGNYVAEQLLEFASSQPGFFTPYRGPADFAFAVTRPILSPIALGILAGVSAVAVAVAAVAFVGGLVVAAATALFDDEIAIIGLSVALCGVAVALAATALTILFAVSAAIAGPASVAGLFTRAGASVAMELGYLREETSAVQYEVVADTPIIDAAQPNGCSYA